MHRSPFVIPADIAAKVDEIMSASRTRFGRDVFRMEDPPATPPAGDQSPPADPPKDPPADPPVSDALGDAGKQALDRMKADRNTARDAAATEKLRADALQAKLDGKEAEHLASQEAQKVKDEALAGANLRILKAEVKAAAKGVLADPTDALTFLDLAKLEVSDEGDVDATAVKAALDDLISKKPYLAAQGGSRFQGSADGGTRNGSAPSIDDQIAEATKAGNHLLAIALKQQRSAELLAKKS